MTDADRFDTLPRPTAARPLLGLTVLVVEDSRYACDALRLLCLRSGARIRRADCLASARRHLQVYRPTAILIDLGLPDGSGTELIRDLAQATPRIPVILGLSGDPFVEDLAMQAGANGFIAKPLQSLAGFQNAVIDHLPLDRQPKGPRLVNDEPIFPDPIAYRDDMAHAADVLGEGTESNAVDYVTQFLSGVARSAGDDILASAATDLAAARRDRKPYGYAVARLSALVQERLAEPVAI